MKIITLSDIIGETIESIRCTYKYMNEYDLQEFHSYLKLSSGNIISIPIYDNEEFSLTKENIEYYKSKYEEGEEIVKSAREKIYGQRIDDMYFCYYDYEIDFDNPAFFKLHNGYYITERNFGPPGITDVNLLIFDQKQFEQKITSLKLTIKSYNKEIKNVC